MAQPDVSEPATAPATRVRYAVLASACALAVITYIHRAGFQSNSPELLRDLGMDVRDLSAMTVAFMLAYGLFEVPWGRLGDRFGAREPPGPGRARRVADDGRPWRRSCCCRGCTRSSSGSCCRCGSSSGCSRRGRSRSSRGLIADWMPTTERGSAQGFIWMCSRAGGVLAPMVMVWLFHRLGNWRSPLVLGAGLGVIWCLAVWPWLRNRPEQMPRVNAAERALIACGTGRAEAGPLGTQPRGGDAPLVERLGPVVDVRLPRLSAATSSCTCSPAISRITATSTRTRPSG